MLSEDVLNFDGFFGCCQLVEANSQVEGFSFEKGVIFFGRDHISEFRFVHIRICTTYYFTIFKQPSDLSISIPANMKLCPDKMIQQPLNCQFDIIYSSMATFFVAKPPRPRNYREEQPSSDVTLSWSISTINKAALKLNDIRLKLDLAKVVRLLEQMN